MLVEIYQKERLLDKAESLATAYLERHPEDASMWGRQARTAELQGDTASEIAHLKKAYALDPENMLYPMVLYAAMERFRLENPPHIRLGRAIKRFFGG